VGLDEFHDERCQGELGKAIRCESSDPDGSGSFC
jgi:hypothetical protein